MSCSKPGCARSSTIRAVSPGSYTLATKNREPQTTASFTVGTTEGPPLRIVVR